MPAYLPNLRFLQSEFVEALFVVKQKLDGTGLGDPRTYKFHHLHRGPKTEDTEGEILRVKQNTAFLLARCEYLR